jgi:hypothetical protein
MYAEIHPYDHFCHTGLIRPFQDDAEPLETSFELNDTLFAKANIEKVNEVYLWLGVRLVPIQPSGSGSRSSERATDRQAPHAYSQY